MFICSKKGETISSLPKQYLGGGGGGQTESIMVFSEVAYYAVKLNVLRKSRYNVDLI